MASKKGGSNNPSSQPLVDFANHEYGDTHKKAKGKQSLVGLASPYLKYFSICIEHTLNTNRDDSTITDL